MRNKDTKPREIFDIRFPDTSDLEKQVIADAVIADYSLGDVIPLIHPDFFSTETRRGIWQTIVEHYNAGKGVTLDAIGPVLGQPFYDEVLPKLADDRVVIRPEEHARLLRDGAAKRRAYLAVADFLQNVMAPSASEQEVVTRLEQFNRAVEGPAPLMNEVVLKDALANVRKEVKKTEKAVEQGEKVRITTGFKYMDSVFYGGLKPGQLVVLAARPSVGKTAVMLQMAKAAAKAGIPAQVFSLEMTAEELAERLLFSTGNVRPIEIARGEVDWQLYEKAEGELNPLPFYINDFSRSLDEIVGRIQQAVKAKRCGVAFVDYLGLIRDTYEAGNAKLYQVIGKITGTFKALAKRCRIPIVLLCQLNRDAAREDRTPELFDLRDSGSIEQDADIVLMLQADKVMDVDEPRTLRAWLRKHRGGIKDFAFVLHPNKTYSAFEEEKPAQAVDIPAEPEPVQQDLPF